ncbi:hypothetical protein ACRALDRAFT_209490 [Sodiomyces alcalophilus JCM 7366]|uniref:uncharacterized protein n=1 Tax=Sodiomyces alcalophilus JCM 7366 TaxID=591952 RepID=UPI0039B45F5E
MIPMMNARRRFIDDSEDEERVHSKSCLVLVPTYEVIEGTLVVLRRKYVIHTIICRYSSSNEVDSLDSLRVITRVVDLLSFHIIIIIIMRAEWRGNFEDSETTTTLSVHYVVQFSSGAQVDFIFSPVQSTVEAPLRRTIEVRQSNLTIFGHWSRPGTVRCKSWGYVVRCMYVACLVVHSNDGRQHRVQRVRNMSCSSNMGKAKKDSRDKDCRPPTGIQLFEYLKANALQHATFLAGRMRRYTSNTEYGGFAIPLPKTPSRQIPLTKCGIVNPHLGPFLRFSPSTGICTMPKVMPCPLFFRSFLFLQSSPGPILILNICTMVGTVRVIGDMQTIGAYLTSKSLDVFHGPDPWTLLHSLMSVQRTNTSAGQFCLVTVHHMHNSVPYLAYWQGEQVAHLKPVTSLTAVLYALPRALNTSIHTHYNCCPFAALASRRSRVHLAESVQRQAPVLGIDDSRFILLVRLSRRLRQFLTFLLPTSPFDGSYPSFSLHHNCTMDYPSDSLQVQVRIQYTTKTADMNGGVGDGSLGVFGQRYQSVTAIVPTAPVKHDLKRTVQAQDMIQTIGPCRWTRQHPRQTKRKGHHLIIRVWQSVCAPYRHDSANALILAMLSSPHRPMSRIQKAISHRGCRSLGIGVVLGDQAEGRIGDVPNVASHPDHRLTGAEMISEMDGGRIVHTLVPMNAREAPETVSNCLDGGRLTNVDASSQHGADRVGMKNCTTKLIALPITCITASQWQSHISLAQSNDQRPDIYYSLGLLQEQQDDVDPIPSYHERDRTEVLCKRRLASKAHGEPAVRRFVVMPSRGQREIRNREPRIPPCSVVYPP